MRPKCFQRVAFSGASFWFCFVVSSLLCNSSGGQECLLGDVNLDGNVDFADIHGFCELLYSGGCQCEANINNESIVDLLDVWPFRDVLLAQQSSELNANTTVGPGDFFWSTKALGHGAENGDPFVNVNIGDFVTLYLYYTINGPTNSEISDGMAINVATAPDGVIEFTNAGAFNFDIQIQDINLLRRWFYPVEDFQTAREIHPDLVIGLTALNVCQGDGLLADNTISDSSPFLDLGYDADADAFLVGKIEFAAITTGIAKLIAGANDLGIANKGKLIHPFFSSATVFVGSGILGDVNLDGIVDLLDVDPFIERLANGGFQVEADCNQDGFVNLLDVASFVEILSGGQ